MAGDKHDPLRAVRYRTIVADPQQMTVDDCVAVATHDLDKTIDTVQLTIL